MMLTLPANEHYLYVTGTMGRNMRRIFLDCGGHKATSIKLFLATYSESDQYEIYSFEPNPRLRHYFDEYLETVTFIPKAVWVYDGDVPLYLSGKPCQAGSSVYSKKKTGKLDKTPTILPCIDLSKFIRDNFDPSDEIVLKLDIEGAEYGVIQRMHVDDTLSYIDTLYVDFHTNVIPNIKKKHREIITILNQRKITPRHWNALGFEDKQ